MKLYVPALKDELILTKKWNARIHLENRNHEFLLTAFDFDRTLGWSEKSDALRKLFNLPEKQSLYRSKLFRDVEIPSGIPLIVDRIYIRNGQDEYDSITFRIPKVKGRKLHGRFWVKLENANEIEFKIIGKLEK